MKTLFIECRSGAAGDMITAALSGLLDDRTEFEKVINSLDLPGVSFSLKDGKSHMIGGVLCDVKVYGHGEEEQDSGHHHHHHTGYSDVKKLINGLDIPEEVGRDALAVYEIIAEAESRVHGEKVTDIHFHEVGTADAVCDVVSACLLFHELSVDRVVVSPICTGFGTVETCHGILPVPAPATAEILKGIPVYAGNTEGELCTPTGAAILRYFADSFGEMPQMKLERTGTGIGHKDTGTANIIRVFCGDSVSDTADRVTVYSFTVDDMTAEGIGFAADALRRAGALDVYEIPVFMKKNRPGTLMTVLSREEDEDRIEEAIFKHTLTIGVRKERQERLVMEREESLRATSLGDISFKKSRGFGTEREKAEYDDVAAAAEREGLSFDEAKRIIENGSE